MPFAAPPTERNKKRMWITIGVGGAVLLLCCVGGLVGLGVLAVSSGRATLNEARATVQEYLDGLARNDYSTAYDQLCASQRADETLLQFTERERRLPPIEQFSVDPARLDGSRIEVPATVRTTEGTISGEFTVITDRQDGTSRVCGGPR